MTASITRDRQSQPIVLTPPATVAQIADGVPGAVLHVLDAGAHLVNLEQPERVTALVRWHIAVAYSR